MDNITDNSHVFSKNELISIFDNVMDKKMRDVDKNNVFHKTIKHPKITGIAGDVVEQSILGYKADSHQKPDLIVDGVEVELKTTGIRMSKKNKNKYEAKEPMSVTAVSPSKIIHENFSDSSFWHKAERLLLVYYLYESEVTVKAADYAEFPIVGYHFHEFDDEDVEILKNDWELVRDFIKELHETHINPKEGYPMLSSSLRSRLMMIDTAPKWPNPPRFRLKRATVTTFVQKYFGLRLEKLDKGYTSFEEIDKQLHKYAEIYKGKTVQELIDILSIPVKLNHKEDVSKSVTEQIVTSMFGAKSKKISNIELFSKLGICAKTITQTKKNTRTEDTKLFSVNFDEWMDNRVIFEDSSLYSDFNERQFLFIVFEEDSLEDLIKEKKFLGFKRVSFNEEFINKEVRYVWEDVRTKIFNNELKEVIYYDRDKKEYINKNGTIKTAVNFPKASENSVFLRGTGKDSTDKVVEINSIKMYRQNVWIKGKIIIDMLNMNEYI
ncbi:MutH/Sau3AI family endonuclease [Brochothrix thermosphacta]|uniref:MutH/Sau3AI family endonuclease n=1 Tax=Brochothrix thermosphacta TaxID=2756 RepID=UPI0039B0F8C5